MVKFTCKTTWPSAFVCWKMFLLQLYLCVLWLVCSYFLLLPGSILEDYTFIRICSFFSRLSILLAYSCSSVSAVTQSCPTLCDPIDCSTPGFPVHHQLLELALTHVHQVGDAIQPSHVLSSPSPPDLVSCDPLYFCVVTSSFLNSNFIDLSLFHIWWVWLMVCHFCLSSQRTSF